MLRGMWDLPGSMIQPVSSGLAGGFFTPEPPGKSFYLFYRKEEMESHSSFLIWEIPRSGGAWRVTVHGFAKELDTTQ